MKPVEPRHGTWAGYNAGCRDKCCREAARRYQAERMHDRRHGQRRTTDVTGTRRRIRALMRIGWSAASIAEAANVSPDTIYNLSGRPRLTVIHTRTRDRIAAAYALLAGRPGPSKATVVVAKRLGYASPMAWDSDTIDDPDAEPDTGPISHTARKHDVDEVAVIRFISGDDTISLTKAERTEAARRLRGLGWSDRRIEIEKGIKVARYLPPAGNGSNTKEGAA